MAMDASENTRWIGFADVDQAFRLLAGMPPVDETVPFRVMDKSNVTQAGVPATNYLEHYSIPSYCGSVRNGLDILRNLRHAARDN